MDIIVNSFADRFNTALTMRNIKPIELAEKTKLSKSTISHYMRGYTKPKSDKLFVLAKALNVSEQWLLGYDVPMEKETFEQKWDREVKEFFDKMNAFEMQLKSLGWSYKHYGCYWWYEYNELGLRPNDEGQLTEDGTGTLIGCDGKKCESCSEKDQFYLFTNGQISFKVSPTDFDAFVNDSQNFFKERLQQLLKKSMKQLFSETDFVTLNAANARTDIEIPENTDTSDDDIMDSEDF